MLNELDVTGINFSKVELKIIESRISGHSICQLSNEKIKTILDQVILRGAAISGCSIPNTDFFADIISEDLEFFILEFGYGELTKDEILLALRINSNSDLGLRGISIDRVQFFGNCFNVDFFSKLLENYMRIRLYVERKIQNKLDRY